MDPVRWWPSGVPQGMATVGTALATYTALSKLGNVTPRARVLAAIGAAGATSTHIIYNSAIENSVGFHRLMYGWTEYKRTNKWPSLDAIAQNKTDTEINDFVVNAMKSADDTIVKKIVEETSKNNFLPSNLSDNFFDSIVNIIFKEIMQFIKPVQVEGVLGDLIGQRMFIEIILFLTSIFIVFLFIVLLLNLIFLLNKDRILKRFNNKFFNIYFNYQELVSKIALFYLPIFILLGLYTLTHGLHWLLANQIPYDVLGIDLNQFISGKK